MNFLRFYELPGRASRTLVSGSALRRTPRAVTQSGRSSGIFFTGLTGALREGEGGTGEAEIKHLVKPGVN